MQRVHQAAIRLDKINRICDLYGYMEKENTNLASANEIALHALIDLRPNVDSDMLHTI
jgi:hypothetical protein